MENAGISGIDSARLADSAEESGESIEAVLDAFLASVEADAYRLALSASHNPDEAVDIVQDAMMTLVQHYRDKQSDELAPLFHRILQNRIRDWYRRRSVKHTLLRWSGLGDTTQATADIPAPEHAQPDALLGSTGDLLVIEEALRQLPLRQQQTFLLRAWKEMSVEETAHAMSVSTGSVKTHYSRALKSLRVLLEETGEGA